MNQPANVLIGMLGDMVQGGVLDPTQPFYRADAPGQDAVAAIEDAVNNYDIPGTIDAVMELDGVLQRALDADEYDVVSTALAQVIARIQNEGLRPISGRL